MLEEFATAHYRRLYTALLKDCKRYSGGGGGGGVEIIGVDIGLDEHRATQVLEIRSKCYGWTNVLASLIWVRQFQMCSDIFIRRSTHVPQ